MEPIVKELVKKYWRELKKKKNVLGYSGRLLPKVVSGRKTNIKAFVVYVSRKVPAEDLEKRDLVPEELVLDGENRGRLSIPTDVVEIGEIVALSCCGTDAESSSVRDRIRPVVAGISAMGYWPGSTACTLGYFAWNKKEGEEAFLGYIMNNHCSSDENKYERGISILQPSPYDGGVYPRDEIGKLWRTVKIKFDEYTCSFRNTLLKILRAFQRTPENRVDASLIKPREGISWEPEVYYIGQLAGVREAELGEKVQKVGRTTGWTKDGEVIDTDWSGYVQYSRGRAFFTDCVLIYRPEFSRGGDSSSPIVSQEEDPPFYLGMLFAGSETHTIACKPKNLESELEIKIWRPEL